MARIVTRSQAGVRFMPVNIGRNAVSACGVTTRNHVELYSIGARSIGGRRVQGRALWTRRQVLVQVWMRVAGAYPRPSSDTRQDALGPSRAIPPIAQAVLYSAFVIGA